MQANQVHVTTASVKDVAQPVEVNYEAPVRGIPASAVHTR